MSADPQIAALRAENERLRAAWNMLDLAVLRACSTWPTQKDNMARLAKVALEAAALAREVPHA